MTRGLLPIFVLFTRAVRDDVRSKFPALFRAFLLVALALLIRSTEWQFARFTAAGNVLLQSIAMVNFAGLTILGFVTFGSAITEEKEDGTLDLLRLTRLNPLAILLGKSTARFVGGLLFLIVQIPFALLCVALGGVRPSQILEVYAILCAYLLLLCNLGLLCSVLCRTTARAITLTTVVCCLFFATPFVVHFLNRNDSPSLTAFAERLYSFNPCAELAAVISGRASFPFPTHSMPFAFAGSLLCFCSAWLAAQRFSSAGPVPVATPKSALRRRREIPRPWHYPLAWKDFYLTAATPLKIILRQILYFVTTFAYAWADQRSEQDFLYAVARGAIVSGAVGFAIEQALAAAAIFGRERREQTLGSLAILPVPATRVIMEKFAGHALYSGPSALLFIAGTILVPDSGKIDNGLTAPGAWHLAIVVNVAVQFVLFVEVIAFLSLCLRRGALVCGLCALLLWNGLFNLYLSILESFGPVQRFGETHDSLYWAVNFFLAVLATIVAVLVPKRLAVCAAED